MKIYKKAEKHTLRFVSPLSFVPYSNELGHNWSEAYRFVLLIGKCLDTSSCYTTSPIY